MELEPEGKNEPAHGSKAKDRGCGEDWETPVLEARKENSLPQHTLVCDRWKRSKGSQK